MPLPSTPIFYKDTNNYQLFNCSLSYKLASSVRRSIEVNHTDPAGRDHNGYLTGSYYVGVFGWCTPDNFVVNWATDGPCSYAARTLYNVTVQLSPRKYLLLFENTVYSLYQSIILNIFIFPLDAKIVSYMHLINLQSMYNY